MADDASRHRGKSQSGILRESLHRDRGAERTAPRPRDDTPRRSRDEPGDGVAARDVAASALFSVFVEKRAFDDVFSKVSDARGLAPRDRAFARNIASTVLRHRGSLNAVIGRFLGKPLPENQGRLEPILLSAAAQLLVLKTPPHAAISLAVDQCRVDRSAQRFAKLANAVLRRVSVEGPDIWAGLDHATLNCPTWMLARWQKNYGADLAHRIAAASLGEAPLDLSIKDDAEAWAERLGGITLPTGSVRISASGRIEDLAGYDEGAWWVQDAAARLPALLFGDLRGRHVADLCAAPGGKTVQLVVSGAHVTAVDKSPGRLNRMKANLARLGLDAEVAVADAATFAPGRLFDAILIDAPCTATGTIRRHPDILHLKRSEDVAALASVQAPILRRAAELLKVGGTLVYCTCSLEPEEGRDQIDAFLAEHANFARVPVTPADLAAADQAAWPELQSWISADGDVRTLPCHLDTLPSGLKGLDGFFAARLVRRS